jgi:hypothetical protein
MMGGLALRGRRRREALSDLLRLPAANPMMKVMRREESCYAISDDLSGLSLTSSLVFSGGVPLSDKG